MTDNELELALLDRYLVQHKLGEQEDPDRRDKCSRELDLRKLLSELSGKEGADLDYDAQVWLKRLTKPRQGGMPGPLRLCSSGSKNGSTHKLHLRAFFDDTGLPAADRAQELRDKLGVSAELRRNSPVVGIGPAGVQRELWGLLHPDISRVARDRFEAGQYADAVEASLKEVNQKVKDLVWQKTGREYDGADLMNRAFSLSNPVLELADLTTQSGRDEQKGYMQLFAGAMTGIRNPKAHANVLIDDTRAIHLLFVASLLRAKLDEAR